MTEEKPEENIQFGVNNLHTPSKLTKIYLNVKSSLYSHDDYFRSRYEATVFEEMLINDFREREGNLQKAITALLCSGYSYLYSKLGNIVDEKFAHRLNKLMMRLYAYADKIPFPFWSRVKLGNNDYNMDNYSRVIDIRFPMELYAMLEEIGYASGLKLSTIVIFTMRIGALHYNEFIQRFSTNFFEIDDEIYDVCIKAEEMFSHKLKVAIEYNINALGMIKDRYGEYLRDKMKEDIDMFISEWRERNEN